MKARKDLLLPYTLGTKSDFFIVKPTKEKSHYLPLQPTLLLRRLLMYLALVNHRENLFSIIVFR